MSTKIIHAPSGHRMYVVPASAGHDKHPAFNTGKYTRAWICRNAEKDGVPLLFMAKGYPGQPNHYHVWYVNGAMWSGVGATMSEAISGAQRDGWIDATYGKA